MPKRLAIATIAALLMVIPLCAQLKYNVTIDLANVTRESDRVKVTINTPAIKDEKIVYQLPAYIPGSYTRKDFGRFVHEFYALDVFGFPMKVKKLDDNTILIKNPKGMTLQKIEYWVDDTWDAEKKSPKEKDAKLNYIGQAGGTNIDAGRNFVLNFQGYVGYLQGYNRIPYEVTILKPGELCGTTAANLVRESPGRDLISVNSYAELVDNPAMYCMPDTAAFTVGKMHVSVSVFSENGLVKAEEVRQYLIPIGTALGNFIGPMPPAHYAFLFYFKGQDTTAINKYGSYGALGHNASSFYFLPELRSQNDVKSLVQHSAAREFLRMFGPLNVSHEDSRQFDFSHPKMSQHLWLYEGVTEYFSQLMLVRDSLISDDDFIRIMRNKIEAATHYPDMSFTEMSRNILEPGYKSNYPDVYEKGALIAFLLDIRLMELSKGEMGLPGLLGKLTSEYAAGTPFNDDQLIDELVRLSYPEVRPFFNEYVIGSKPLPYTEYFAKIGWNYYYTKADSTTTFGKFAMYYRQDSDAFVVTRATGSNSFGLQNGDLLLSVNDKDVTYKTFESVMEPVYSPWGNLPVTIRFARGGKEYSVAARPETVPVYGNYVIEENELAGEEQVRLRRLMLSNYYKK